MRTLKLFTLIIICGFISLSCSNEEVTIEDISLDSEMYNKGKPSLFTPTSLDFGDVTIHGFELNTSKGQITRLLYWATRDSECGCLIDRVELYGTSVYWGGVTQSVSCATNFPGLKKKDFKGLEVPGYVEMTGGPVYHFKFILSQAKKLESNNTHPRI